MIIPTNYSRCRGELMGDDWGHEDRTCERREGCKRYIATVLEHGNVPPNAVYVGWACATDAYDEFIADGFELQIEQDGV